MVRFAAFLAAAAIVLLFARSAFAVGGVLVTPGDSVRVVDVRYALAMSAAQTTRWASLHVERFPGAMMWVLPMRPGARVEEVGDAWLDALDFATAPRIVSAPCGDGGTPPPKVVTERRPPLGPTTRALRSAVLDDGLALRAFAQSWGFALPAQLEERFEEVSQRGFVFLALVYGGPAEATATRTVRITDDAIPSVPLFLTASADEPVPVTTFILADTRTRLGPGPEIEIEEARVVVTKDGATNYAVALGAALLGARGASWVAEAASHDILFEGARGPAGIEPVSALAPTYFRLATGDDHVDTSDLTMALSGLDPSAAWITRVSGIVPSRAWGDDLAVTARDSERKSPFLVAAGSATSCPPPDGGRGGAGGAPGGPIEPPSHPPPLPPRPPETIPPPPTPPHRPPVTAVEMSCSCSPGPGAPEPTSGDDSCDGSDPGDTSDSGAGYGGSADDSPDESCDGSADDSYGSNDDGCDGSSSSGSGSDDGCSSGSQDADDGCSSGSQDGADSCSTAPSARPFAATRARRPPRSRPRTSAVTLALALAALALVLRRTTQPRRHRRSDQRRASTGDIIGFGQ